MMDKFLLMGVNHKFAPAALRERLSFRSDAVKSALITLSEHLTGETEMALLSTCNRTELILHVEDPCEAEEVGREYLCQVSQLPGDVLQEILYVHRGKKAAHHLLQVAAGLDSLVVGENEIQGQVRKAAEIAQVAGTNGPYLDALFRSAIQCGKRVRAETEIGKTNLSVATLVVELAQERLGDLQQHTALLIGAGKISCLTARELVRAGLHCVLVANRTYERAIKMVQSLGSRNANAVHFDQLTENLVPADIVICSTSAPHIVLHQQAVADAIEQRDRKPMLVVDLAIPRDADPEINLLPDVELFTIDDLSDLVQQRHPMTARAWKESEAILDEILLSFSDWCEARQAVPLIRSLRAKADAIVQVEVERTLRSLGSLSEEQQAAIAYLGQAIVNKLLHDPIICLKNQPEAIQQNEALALVQELFGLESKSHIT